MKIYESYGYTTREAVASIVENNLYGLDIMENSDFEGGIVDYDR